MKAILKTCLNFREKIAIGLVEYTKPVYIHWFKKNQFQLIPKLEDHDVLHVLLNYKTTLVGEIKMQCFLLGNRKRSVYALFTALIGIVLVPEKLLAFRHEFSKGKKCAAISNWDFEYLLSEPLELLQRQALKQPLYHQPLRF